MLRFNYVYLLFKILPIFLIGKEVDTPCKILLESTKHSKRKKYKESHPNPTNEDNIASIWKEFCGIKNGIVTPD